MFPTVMHLSWGYNEPVILCWVERDAFTENYVFTHSFNIVAESETIRRRVSDVILGLITDSHLAQV